MVQQSRLVTWFQQNRSMVVHSLVLTGLVIVALYNAYYLLDDYIHSNVATDVTLKTDDDDLPFLEDISIFLRNERSILPELWSLEHKNWLDEQAAIMMNATNFTESFFLDSKNSSRLSLEGKYRIAYMLGEVWWADHNAVYYGFADTPRTYPHQSMRRFMDLPQLGKLISMLEKELLSYAYQRIDIPAAEQTSNQSAYFSTDLIHTHQFTFTIPVPMHMNRTKNQVRYKIGGSPDLAHTEAENVTKRRKTRLLKSPDFSYSLEAYGSKSQALNKIFGPYYADMNSSVEITAHIINLNVFDTSYVRGKEACDRCGDLKDVEDCLVLCKAQAFKEKCGCVPFLTRKLLHHDGNTGLPYCTGQNYAHCFNATTYKALTDHCTPRDYLPCEIVTNSYIAQVTTVSSKDPFFDLRLWVDKTAYVVFKGKQKNSFLEMLGQLGGNLGLFLSFSLLGVWRFMFFLYKMHQKGKLPRIVKRKTTAPTPVQSLWLQLAGVNWLTMAVENKNAGDNTSAPAENEKCTCEDKFTALVEDNEKLRRMMEEHMKKATDTENKLRRDMDHLAHDRLRQYEHRMFGNNTVHL